MKSLLNTSLRQFLLATILIAVCCAPLFYFLMKYSYSEDLDELIIFRSEEFKETHLPQFTTGEIAIWNKYNEDLQIEPLNNAYVLDKPTQKNFYNKAEGHTIDYRIYYTVIEIEGKHWVLVSRVPMIETKDLIVMQVNQYGLLIVILVISLYFVQRFISRKLWTPFYDTLEKINSFNLEKANAPLFEKTDIREFSQLNDNLDLLIGNSIRTYTQQKEFIENASHELQTPLAIFQSQLDILLLQPALTEEQVEIIRSLYSVSSRLSRLNKNLLLLAKIDNNHYTVMEEIDLYEIWESQQDYFKYQAEDKGLRMDVDIAAPFRITAHKFLLESLINNLLVNAINYNTVNGTISIVARDRQLTIINTGEDKPLDPNKIFRRFNHTSEEKKGNGLGLSIVYQICRFHGWDIHYSFTDKQHWFTIIFEK